MSFIYEWSFIVYLITINSESIFLNRSIKARRNFADFDNLTGEH
jgi:hypothetical protein